MPLTASVFTWSFDSQENKHVLQGIQKSNKHPFSRRSSNVYQSAWLRHKKKVRIFITSTILVCTNLANFTVKVDSMDQTVFNLDTAIYPSIRGIFDENGGPLESCDSNSVQTSVATSMASPEETEIPQCISAENNAMKPQNMNHERATDRKQPLLQGSGKRRKRLYPHHQDDQPASKEVLPISKELVQNTRQYLDMIMNLLDSTTEDMPSKVLPEMKAAMRLSTHMLEQKFDEETKRFNKERSMCEI